MRKTEAWKGQSCHQGPWISKWWDLESDAGCLVWESTCLATKDWLWLLSTKAVLHEASIQAALPTETSFGSVTIISQTGLISLNGLSHQARQLGLCLQTRPGGPLKKEEVTLKFIPHCVLRHVLAIYEQLAKLGDLFKVLGAVPV